MYTISAYHHPLFPYILGWMTDLNWTADVDILAAVVLEDLYLKN